MKIDIVYTWVDPNNKTWLKEKQQYTNTSYNNSECRFNSSLEELKYSLRSIDKYFNKHIRNIFIITNGSIPRFINPNRKDIIIIHDKLLLGTQSYSSVVYESVIHKIPGLSEYYLYFNDDMILLKELHMSDLINKQKQLVWYKESSFFINIVSKNNFLSSIFEYDGNVAQARNNTYKTLKLFDKPTSISHSCRIFKKSLVIQFEQKYKKEIDLLRQEKFRTPTTFCFMDAFCFFCQQQKTLEYSDKKNTKILLQVDNITTSIVNNALTGYIYNFLSTLDIDDDHFLCICDIRKTPRTNEFLKDFLDQLFIRRSKWEKKYINKSYSLGFDIPNNILFIIFIIVLFILIKYIIKHFKKRTPTIQSS